MKTSLTVLGLDLSLSSTGVVILQGSNGPRVHSNHLGGDLRGAERLIFLRDAVLDDMEDLAVDLAVIEGYSYASTQQLPALGELGGVVRVLLYEWGIPHITVAPITLKKFTTGDHKAKKDKMILEVFKRWGYEAENNDMADAYALAQFGLAYLNPSPTLLPVFQQQTVADFKKREAQKQAKKQV